MRPGATSEAPGQQAMRAEEKRPPSSLSIKQGTYLLLSAGSKTMLEESTLLGRFHSGGATREGGWVATTSSYPIRGEEQPVGASLSSLA